MSEFTSFQTLMPKNIDKHVDEYDMKVAYSSRLKTYKRNFHAYSRTSHIIDK